MAEIETWSRLPAAVRNHLVERIDSKFSTVICAPVFTSGQALSTQVPIGPEDGLKHSSWIMCDNLVSLRKADLTNFIGSLSRSKVADLNEALKMAFDLV